jgi:hypothetical protein
MMAALGAKPKELGRELQNIGASPIAPTADDVVHASLNIVKEAATGWRDQEMDTLDSEQQLVRANAQNLVAESESAVSAVNVTDQIRFTEDELRRKQEEYQVLLRTSEDKLEESAREIDDIMHRHKMQATERRSSALRMSKEVEKICKHLKDPNVYVRNRLESVKIFNGPVEAVRQKDVTSTIMGMETVVKTQHLGEIVKVLGGDDFPRKLQQKYKDAGKPICDDLEAMLVQAMYPLVVTLGMEEEGSHLLEILCKKAAYTIEIFSWQNVRDVIAEDIIPLTDERFKKLLAATKNLLDVDAEPKFMQTLSDVIVQYDDLLVRMQRSVQTCADLTREESRLHDQIEDFQAEKLELMTKYPTVAGRKTRMAQLDAEIGVIQDRRIRSTCASTCRPRARYNGCSSHLLCDHSITGSYYTRYIQPCKGWLGRFGAVHATSCRFM